MTILLTGTHLTPAIATIQALRRKVPEARLIYVGRKHTGAAESVEKEEMGRMGAEFKTLTFGKLHRHFTWRHILEWIKLPVGFWQAGKLVLELKPDVVVSFGGYVALPLLVWGKLRGAKLVVHEQTTRWGLANGLVRRLADVSAVSWEGMKEPGVVWTGNPIREEVLALARDSGSGGVLSRVARPGISLSGRPIRGPDNIPGLSVTDGQFPRKKPPSPLFGGFPVLYITGGNQGSRAIDKVLEKILPDLVEKFEVFHQTKSVFNFKHPRYHPSSWFSTAVHADILSRAAISVSRAGANTVTELLFLGIPSILIPLPYSAGGEQQKNAEMMAGSGLGKIIKQEDLSAEGLLGAITDKSYKSYKDYKEREKAKKEQKDRRGEGNTAADKLAEVIIGGEGVEE